MIRISIEQEDADLLEKIVSSLHQAGYATSSDGMTLFVWPERRGFLAQAHHQYPSRTGYGDEVKGESKATLSKRAVKWLLNSAWFELMAPDGRTIKLSNSECCILCAVAEAQGKLVSRRALIAALGQNFCNMTNAG